MKRYDMVFDMDAGDMEEFDDGEFVRYDDAMAEIETLRAENALLRELLGAWYGDVYIPHPNCSCHISPPCNDCISWSGLRETANQTKRILGVK